LVGLSLDFIKLIRFDYKISFNFSAFDVRLVQMVRSIPMLWDKNDPENHKTLKKKQHWDQIALKLGYSGRTPLYKYFSVLRDKFFNPKNCQALAEDSQNSRILARALTLLGRGNSIQ
jgi:Alcohol dehydrogenase transcription factor Myb/SANT-like